MQEHVPCVSAGPTWPGRERKTGVGLKFRGLLLTLNKVALADERKIVRWPLTAHAAKPRNGATRWATAGSSNDAANAGHESNGLARTMRAARFSPIPGRAQIAASDARFTSSGYSIAVRDRWPWLVTRTSTNRFNAMSYGRPTRIGYVPICRPYVTWP